jgi:transcriptional regulator with XRE-family HTH domain
MNEKGWTQAELARRVAPLLKNSRIGRDNISKYVRGKVLPLPHVLDALARVLGCEARDLLPSRGTRATADEHAPLGVRDIGNGRVWLRVDQALEWPMALKILGLLKGADLHP